MSIPKVLHYIWIGDSKMPEIMNSWREKWISLNPQMKVRVWRSVPGLPIHFLREGDQLLECRYPDYLAKCPTLSKRSDVWRYEILEQLGGVYLDTDMEPIRPLENMLDDMAFAGLCNTIYDWSADLSTYKQKTEIGCSILGAEAHHPWVRDMIRLIPARDPVEKLSLAFPFVSHVSGRHPDVHLYSNQVFYPIQWDEYALRGKHPGSNESFGSQTIAVHRWSACWFPSSLAVQS